MFSCKHWYCFNCLEHLLHTAKDTEQFMECGQCQRSIEMQVLQKKEEQFQQNYEKTKKQLTQNTNNNNLINNLENNFVSFGCDEDFAQKDFDLELGIKSRSASLASDNSLGSFVYFSSTSSNNYTGSQDLECNFQLGKRVGITNPNVPEKMLPGENCFIHGMPNTLWCQTCLTVLCRGCNAGSEHKDHKVENQLEAKEFFQNRVKKEFIQIQVSMEEMENFKLLQKSFLLKLLETCCTLKVQIEQELVSNSSALDIDEMKETMKNLQLCFDLLGQETPHEILKLYKVVKDESCKFKQKHKQMLQQCKVQQLLSKSQRILDFEMLKEILQKLDSSSSTTSELNKMSENLFKEIDTGHSASNSTMILTNYCIYRLYMSYMKQQQQFIEQQFMRYQQYHLEQKQNLTKHFKMLQQNSSATHQQHPLDSSTTMTTVNNINEFATFFDHIKEAKPKTYAEIATTPQTNAHQFDCTEISNGFELTPTSNGHFQPYKKPLNKNYEDPRKVVQLLFNPINNDNNQIYYFDFKRNGLHLGRILIKVFSDIAPKMSYNFHALATHEKGCGYTGCKVFECHPNESIITGDIEQNTGYSSRSIYEDVQFIPDDTNVAPFAGAVGMRRAKKKFDSQGLVGSQFRIILTELGFTAIFGCVIEGIEVVRKISQTLVQNDKIHGTVGSNGSLNNSSGIDNGKSSVNGTVSGIFIAQCGLYEFVKRDLMCGI